MSIATDVVDAQIEAYRTKDVERFLACYAEDASVVLFDGTPMFADKHVMREQYGKLFSDSPDLHLTVANRMIAGEFVVDEEHVSGMHFGDMPTEITALSVYRVTNGKIASLMLLFLLTPASESAERKTAVPCSLREIAKSARLAWSVG